MHNCQDTDIDPNILLNFHLTTVYIYKFSGLKEWSVHPFYLIVSDNGKFIIFEEEGYGHCYSIS